MMTVEAKTSVKISVDKEDDFIDVMKKTVRALRVAGRKKESEDFQREATTGGKDFMDVVREWVIIES